MQAGNPQRQGLSGSPESRAVGEAGGSQSPASPAVPCAACGLLTFRRFCHFCTRTVELIKKRRCVSCAAPVSAMEHLRVQGKCSECIGRNAPVSAGTRWLLKQAAAARYNSGKAA